MVRQNRKSWKEGCIERIKELFTTHEKCFIVQCNNVSSSQIHQVRKSLKGDATLLFGKKTLIKYTLKKMEDMGADFMQLFNHLKNNIGIVFVKNDMLSVRERLVANTRVAAAKIGSIAQNDVIIPAHNTKMTPDKISLFQILNVPTKVVKGTLEMITEKQVLRAGQRVGPNEATLLRALNIKPLVYGLVVIKVFEDGSVFDNSLLDISDKDFAKSISEILDEITFFSLGADYPTVMSVSHTLATCFNNMVKFSLGSDYDLPETRQLKEMLENPDLHRPAPVEASVEVPVAAVEKVVEEKKKEVVEESESESDDFGDIFG